MKKSSEGGIDSAGETGQKTESDLNNLKKDISGQPASTRARARRAVREKVASSLISLPRPAITSLPLFCRL